MHLPPIPRFLVRWTIRAFLFVLFVCVPAGIIYLREVGIGYEWKERVEAALGGNGFRTEIGKLTVDPFKGLVAENVVVRDTTEERDVARIEHVVVSINLADSLAGRVTIDQVELDETDVSIPLGKEPDSPRLEVDGVSAELSLLGDQLRISSLEGRVQGIRVVLSGLLRNPRAFHLDQKTAQEPLEKRNELFSQIVETLSSLKFPGQQPEVRVKIHGDLADFSTLQISPILLRSGPIIAPNWRAEGVDAEADYENRILSIKRFKLRGREGALNLTAQWQNNVLDFEASSTLMLEPFARLFPKDSLKDFKFASTPQLDAAGQIVHASSPSQYNVTGSMQLGKFSFRGMDFDAFSTDFAASNGKIFLRDTKLRAAGGEIGASVLFAPEDFRVQLSNTIAPTAFAPLLGKKEREAMKLITFRDAPYLQLDLRGPKPDFAALTGTGFLRLGRTSMRGSALDWGQSKLEIADSAITYRDFSLGRGKATGKGTFVYDFAGQQVRLQDVESTMPPVDVMMWIDPKIAEVIKPYRFRQPPKVQADGMIHLKEPEKNDLHLAIQSDTGLDYDLLERTLKFGRTLANVDITGTKVIADIKSAELMEGNVGVNAVVSIDPADPTFGAQIDIRRVDFAQLTKLYFDYDDSLGVGSGNFKFTARMGQEQQMRGEGSLRVEDGHVFAIPILGPLSEIINKIIPGAGFQTARLATAEFTVGDEKISTKNLKVEGAGFSLFGSGDIYFVTDKMNMSVRINARGIPGLVLFPVSKLFEYVSTGSVSKPEWRPKIIPRFGGGG
jgi:AsmA-like C-terminal region